MEFKMWVKCSSGLKLSMTLKSENYMAYIKRELWLQWKIGLERRKLSHLGITHILIVKKIYVFRKYIKTQNSRAFKTIRSTWGYNFSGINSIRYRVRYDWETKTLAK